MQPVEVRDSGKVLGDALDEVAELARDVHRAVAGRIFGMLGSPAAPVRAAHDAISAVAYGGTRLGVRYLPRAAGAVAGALREPTTTSVDDSPAGHFALGALGGWAGDRLASEGISLAPRTSLRTHTGRLRTRPTNVVHDVGEDATERLVIFLHGLCENERFWWFGAEKHYGSPSTTYGSLLRDEQGWTPLYGVYNTGLHISENGRLLAEYVQDVVDAWPVPVNEIALVGHSMGGLVARSASQWAADHGMGWASALRHVVGLGAPHLGAPLERFTNWGTHRLGRLPETRPFATLLNRRSVGIKDLRYGSLVEQDWDGFDADDLLTDHTQPSALLPGVAYSMVAATLSRRADGVLRHDLLVQHSSAHGTGPTKRIEFEVDRLFHVGGKHHFDLLGDPLVYEQLRVWLEGADGSAPAEGPTPRADAEGDRVESSA